MVGTVRPHYTATVERADGWWAIRVAELPGVFSQARRLDRVEAMARDAIAQLLEVAHESFDVTVQEVLDDQTGALVAAAIQARADAQKQHDIASTKSRDAVQALTKIGLAQRDIGQLLELSHQRVGQLSAAGRTSAVTPVRHEPRRTSARPSSRHVADR